MTPDERKMLEDLASKIAQTPPPPKDADAEALIRTKIGSRPDALYLMTQTVLIQNLALQQAQQQIQQLQRSSQSGQISGPSTFMNAGPGGQGGSSYSQPGQQYSAPPPQYAATGAPASGAPSFLRGAAQTAAGVAAGALAFEGIQSLFGGHGGGFGGGGMFGGGGIGGYGQPMEENIVNNYYDSPSGDRGSGSGQDDYQAADNSSNVDDTQYDNSSDNSSNDDSGGFDDNSGGDNFA